MFEDEEEEGEPIDWEFPFDDIRSAEIDDITMEFMDEGVKLKKYDDKDQAYEQFKWHVVVKNIATPKEIVYRTSSKKLINDLQLEQPLEGKTLNINRTGTGFQTRYKVKEV